MKTIGLMVAIAIAFTTVASPQREKTQADTLPPPAAAVSAEWDVDPALLEAIDKFDSKISNVEAIIAQYSTEVAAIEKCHADDIAAIDARLKVLESNLKSIVEVRVEPRTPVKSVAGAVVKSGAAVVKGAVKTAAAAGRVAAAVATAPIKVAANYTPRWRNYDGRTLRQHGIDVHGFDPSWTTAQIAAAHDAWHDANGGDPPTASRSRAVTVSRSSTSSCPGGQCPTSRTRVVQSRGGLFGFGLLGRRR